MRLVVAIDGPGGAGKSTVAAALAARLDVPHVDTGAFYRAATLACLRAAVDLADEDACARVVAPARIERVDGRTRLDGDDVEEAIRGPEVTRAVSEVSAHQAVRLALLARQREGVSSAGGVVEGRDAGTAVVPDADLKVWLTASPHERAARRAAQIGAPERGTVETLARDLARRDAADAEQMARAEEALVVDTTGQSVDELVEALAARATSAARERSAP